MIPNIAPLSAQGTNAIKRKANLQQAFGPVKNGNILKNQNPKQKKKN